MKTMQPHYNQVIELQHNYCRSFNITNATECGDGSERPFSYVCYLTLSTWGFPSVWKKIM